jgi:hypothetical protein
MKQQFTLQLRLYLIFEFSLGHIMLNLMLWTILHDCANNESSYPSVNVVE